jgi:serine/threonine protein kinase/tetratricopeptide (TPR) repeat protein
MSEITLFSRALEIADLQQRAAFLDDVCKGDAELRDRLDRLLARFPDAGNFLENYPSDSDVTRPYDAPAELEDAVEKTDTVVGPYTLCELIGEGGMGSVWRAKQTVPVKRFVALKLIKAGMDSKQVLARFSAERQALALMDHPNIAKVFDGGVFHGRPYFVMELVKGIPITEYCDQHKLTPDDRLRLFVSVCQAIQHAHQKGIIHRDIKPRNVLVALYDDKPVVKVIDFGVAKAIGGNLTDLSIDTRFGSILGTPEYMSPEQATFNNLDVDTRSDVYSLGVLLYELLTGSPPFTRKDLEKKGVMEMLRVVREDEPQRPSDKLSTADTLPTLSVNRGTEPKRLTGLLRNELDWIVMKSLEKDRARRYETANGFAVDVNRYLSGEAVQAHPPSKGYRLKKFASRNRPQVIATSLVLIALIAGVIGTTIGLLEANKQTGIAQKNEAEAKKQEGLARNETKKKEFALALEELRRKEANAFRDMVLEALRATTDTDVAQLIGSRKELRSYEKTYLEAIAKRWQTIARNGRTDMHSRAFSAEGHFRVANVWKQLGRLKEARQEFELAVAILEKLADEFPTMVECRLNLANNYQNLGDLMSDTGNLNEAVEQYNKALTIRKKLPAELADVPEHRSALANCHNNLGNANAKLRKNTEAREQLKLALVIREMLVADYPAEPEYRNKLSASYLNLGRLLNLLGNRVEAQVQLNKALVIQEKLVADFPNVPDFRYGLALKHNNLGIILHDMGKPSEALEQYKKTLILQEKLTAEFPNVTNYQYDLGGTYCNIGFVFAARGQFNESLNLFNKAIATLSPVYLAEPSDAIAKEFLRNSHHGRAQIHDRLQKYTDAVKDWVQTVELSPPTKQAEYRCNLAVSRLQAGMVAEALVDVAALTKSPNWNANQWYGFACVYAVACGKFNEKKQEYAERAMELLKQAVNSGWKDVSHMKKDTDLDALRDREDYKQLVNGLENAKK